MIAIEIPEVSYLPVAQSRRMLSDMPQGYAYAGPAYGHKNGPAIGVIGAVSSISAGIAAGGFLGGLLIAGGIAGAIGAVTGNKTLSLIGGLSSLAGGFIGVDGAGFMNPFAENAGQSALSAGTESVFSSIKEAFGFGGYQMPQAVSGYNLDGSAILEEAVTSGGEIVGAAAESGGGGLLGSLGKNKDLLNAVVGGVDAFQNQPLINATVDKTEAQTDLTNAQTAQTNFTTDLAKQRQQNMQFQNTGNLPGVDPNAQLYNTGPASGSEAGRYAVVVGNEVKYVSQAELDALRAQQQQQPTGGMIQGVA